MKALVQRVLKASVSVGDEIISSIGPGLCVFIGISRKDGPKDAEFLARKLLNLRVFEEGDGKRWDKNVMEKHFEILCVSQFTLQCTLKGYKPDFHNAMNADDSEQFYENFIQQLREGYSEEKIKDGRFGAMMQVNITNDGPVTIPIETPLNIQGKVKPDKWATNKSKGEPKGKKKDKEPNPGAGRSSREGAATGTQEGVEGATGTQEDIERAGRRTQEDGAGAKDLSLDSLNLNEQ